MTDHATLLACYRSGQIPEAAWQEHLKDEGLRAHALQEETGRLQTKAALAVDRARECEAELAKLREGAEPDGWICEDEFTFEQEQFDAWVAEGLSPQPFILSARSPAAPEGREDRCATEGCENRATNEFIRGDVGSHYCGDCFVKVVEACDTPRPTRAVTEAMVDAAQDVLLKHVEDRALILQALTAALAQEGK